MINKTAALVPWLLVGIVRTLDSPDKADMGTLEVGARDEPAHLATSLLVLLALAGPRRMLAHRSETAIACAASMAIDLDHLPLYVESFPFEVAAVPHGRPVTHSWTTIAGLAALAGLVRRHRLPLAAGSAGVALHFVRDIATGPGLPVWWPFERRERLLPYRLYSWLLVLLAAVGSCRIWRSAGS